MKKIENNITIIKRRRKKRNHLVKINRFYINFIVCWGECFSTSTSREKRVAVFTVHRIHREIIIE